MRTEETRNLQEKAKGPGRIGPRWRSHELEGRIGNREDGEDK